MDDRTIGMGGIASDHIIQAIELATAMFGNKATTAPVEDYQDLNVI